MDLLFATGNENKYELMKRRLSKIKEINVVMPKHIGVKVDVEEDGKTAEENAMKKARAYYEKTKLPVIAEDSGLYVEKFNDEDQPGLFVRRVNGIENLTDEEIINHYMEKLRIVGGESLANYRTGIALIDNCGKIYSTTIDEEKFLFTTKINNKQTINGGTLDCISYDIKNNKYFNELTEQEKNYRYRKIDEAIVEIVNKIL